jgi:hypothetical protein
MPGSRLAAINPAQPVAGNRYPEPVKGEMNPTKPRGGSMPAISASGTRHKYWSLRFDVHANAHGVDKSVAVLIQSKVAISIGADLPVKCFAPGIIGQRPAA